jgi:hypothetical protein
VSLRWNERWYPSVTRQDNDRVEESESPHDAKQRKGGGAQ